MIEPFDKYFRADLDHFVKTMLDDALRLGARPDEFRQELMNSLGRVMLSKAVFSELRPRQVSVYSRRTI